MIYPDCAAGTKMIHDDSFSKSKENNMAADITNIYIYVYMYIYIYTYIHRGVDKSLARPTSRSIWFDGENISFDARLVIYINCTNITPIMIINRIYENHNLLSL